MTGDWRALRGELSAASRHLLRCANRGDSRNRFLREASDAILRLTGAAGLELWFEGGEVIYEWCAVARPHPSFRLTDLSAQPAGEQWLRLRKGSSRAGALLEQALLFMDPGGRLAASAERTRGGSLWLGDVAIMPFEIDPHNKAVLRLSSDEPKLFAQDQVESYESLARLLGVAMAIRRAQAALTERVKELTCMYRIAQIAAESDLCLDDTLQEIVELLPLAWQHPDITRARIVLGDRTFCSSGFEMGPQHLFAEVHVRGTQHGRVEVFCANSDEQTSDEPRHPGESPFLPEERHLIEGVARELAFIIERRLAEEEKVRLQEQIRRSDRLATVGLLTAGVAHELNEPLGNILGFAQLARKDPDLAAQTRRDIERIVTASLYAREIIKKLMFFSRQSPSRKSNVNLNRVIEDGISLLESRCASAGVTVRLGLAPELPMVEGDYAQLQQVVVNLVVNAIQATSDGGTLRIDTVHEDNAVCSTFEDSGAGIAPENLESIFVPFFTTKEVGQGTGLGLSVVHGIVNSHGGSVRVQSEVGRGARFEIRFPALPNTVGEASGDNAKA